MAEPKNPSLMRRRTSLAAVVALSLLTGGCGATSPIAATPASTVGVVQSVIFAFGADLAAMTTPGMTAQVTALGILTTGRTQDVTATCSAWTSNDLRVLTVDRGGLLTAQSDHGSALISTTCQGVAAGTLVTVNPPPAVFVPAPPPSTSSACPRPPYEWDANPNVLRCREPNGRFADSVCCGH